MSDLNYSDTSEDSLPNVVESAFLNKNRIDDDFDLSPVTKSKPKKKSNTKAIVNEEKIKAKKAAARERILKTIMVKQQKNIQPGECMKFIQVDMSPSIRNFDFYQETLTMLESSSVTYCLNSLVIPNSLMWTRIIEEDSVDDDNNINTLITKEKQKSLVIIWDWAEVIKRIYDKSFTATLSSITSSMPQMTLSLLIYGIEGYFDYCNQRSNKKIDSVYEGINDMPKLSRKDFETHLIDIQLVANCSIRLVEKSTDMSLLIYQYTKAIAEIPYKLETRNKLHQQMDFYAAGDNKNTIKVDTDGYGLKKLWLKQLCMFNNSGLAIAEAICSMYASPEELMNVRNNNGNHLKQYNAVLLILILIYYRLIEIVRAKKVKHCSKIFL